MRAAKIAGLTLLLAVPAAAQTTIDNFNTNMPAVLSDPPGGSSNTANAGILGGNRGVVVDNLAGAGPTTVNATGGNLVLTVTATTPDSRGEARLQWDADTDPLVLSTGGFNPGVDLTTGNSGGFVVGFTTSSVGAEIEITVHDDNVVANFSRAARRVAAGGAQLVRIPFSEFRVAGGAGANFADVRAIELTVRAGEGSVSINEFVTSPPVLGATKVDIQTVDTDVDTRVDPGDRVRYTVTITNTGNQATTVDLSDTVDVNTAIVANSTSATPIARNDQYGWFGNVTLTADGTPFPTLLANDDDPDGDTVTVQSVTGTSQAGGTVTLVNAATGEFSYSPPAGFKGVDAFNYTIVDDNSNTSTATANIQLQGVVWFVDDSNTSPPHLGTLADPFQTLASVNGTDLDEPGDIIFLYDDDGTPYPGGHVMEAEQQFLGEGVGLILDGTTIVAAGGTPQMTNSGGHGITLALNSTIRGLDVQGTSQDGIAGGNFGTLTTSSVNVTNIGGSALLLTNGTLAATFGTLSSSGTFGATGIELATVTGIMTATSTSLTNPAGAGILVTNSPGVTINFGPTTITDTAIGSGATATGIDIDTGNAGATFVFPNVNLTTDGAGIVANNTTLSIQGVANSIVATNGVALDLVNTLRPNATTFATLSSINSVGKGVNLDADPSVNSFIANAGTISGPAGVAFDINGGLHLITYAGSVSNTTNNRLIEITNRTGGTVNFSGNLSSTGSGNGILVQGLTGGTSTINFSGSSKVLSTGADPAVTLATNTAATINFTGGGLDIDTTTGTGFNATGGATAINVAGSGNSINSVSATALNVNATTIGASNLTFESISSGNNTAAADPANGITLNSTGSSGSLIVTGDGDGIPDASGGLVQSTTGVGISLNTTRASLTELNISNTGNHGMEVTSVTNFTYQDATVFSAGDGNEEQGITILNIFGTSLIEDVVMDDITEDGIQVRQNSATAGTLTFRRLNIQDHVAGFGEAGIEIQPDMASNLTVLVDDSDFAINTNAIMGVAFSTSASHTGTLRATIQNNVFNCANAFGAGGAQVLGGGSGTSHYRISGNQVNNTKFNGLLVNSDGSQTTHAIIENNILDGNGATNNGFGISMRQDENSTMNVLINGNTMGDFNADHIYLLSQDATVDDAGIEFSATITGNNSVQAPLDGFGAGLLVEIIDNTPNTLNDTCLDVRLNTLKGTDTAQYFDYDLSIQLAEDVGATYQMVQINDAALLAANPGTSHASIFANAAVTAVPSCTLPIAP